MKSLTEIRQTKTLVFIFTIFFLPFFTQAQDKAPEIDYSIRSNILNPDTLKGDQKAIFKHFIKLSSKEVEEMPPLKVKDEFAKLGITLLEKDRFSKAWDFLDLKVLYHKKDVELWQEFTDLAPESVKQ